MNEKGFHITEAVFTEAEIENIIICLEKSGLEKKFGVREVLKSNPTLQSLLFTENFIDYLKSIDPVCDKCIKSIYFDKPPHANWIVNWHQDLTINLQGRKEVIGYKNWRVGKERTVVQPDRKLLENIFTVRIHLDDCTEQNGALRVIENSHKRGVIDIKYWMQKKSGKERICEVKKGGVLAMKPLLLHASRRTENNKNRRVLHVEFCSKKLPNGLNWNEKVNIP